jgi:hypothetical protein
MGIAAEKWRVGIWRRLEACMNDVVRIGLSLHTVDSVLDRFKGGGRANFANAVQDAQVWF